MIATGLALGIGLAAHAATQVIGAKVASNASKDAAKIQAAGTKEAEASIREGLGTLRDLYQPYVSQGASTMGTLSRLTAAPQGARYAAPPPPQAIPPMSTGPQGPPAGSRPSGGIMARVGEMMHRPPQPGTLGSLSGGGGGYMPGGDGMVMLESPDGERQAVPARMAEQFVARGARRVQ